MPLHNFVWTGLGAQCTLHTAICFIAVTMFHSLRGASMNMHTCMHASIHGYRFLGFCDVAITFYSVFLTPIFLLPPSSLSLSLCLSPLSLHTLLLFPPVLPHHQSFLLKVRSLPLNFITDEPDVLLLLWNTGKLSRGKKFCANGFKNNNNNSIGGSRSTSELLLFIHTRARWTASQYRTKEYWVW